MSDAAIPAGIRVPTVYFIDDSATMREVIKIAFRKESINVIACHDAASALAQFPESRPDAVITDVIMPDMDGYEVCRFVKEHSELGATPVILMSGVVNRQVAERAMEVRADELMRKPFQPQELVTRVKSLLNPKAVVIPTPRENSGEAPRASAPGASLSSLFAPPVVAAPPVAVPSVAVPSVATQIVAQPTLAPPVNSERPAAFTPAPVSRPIAAASPVAPDAARPAAGAGANLELLRMRGELRRLEMLVKKLQSELEAERAYCAELESQLRVLQETS